MIAPAFKISSRDVETFKESLEAEKPIDFRTELLKARMVCVAAVNESLDSHATLAQQFAESPSEDARRAYVFYLLKSDAKLDLVSSVFGVLRAFLTRCTQGNAQYHLMELLADQPLDKTYLFSLALAQFKSEEFKKALQTLDKFFAIPADNIATPNGENENDDDTAETENETEQVMPTTVERKAACLQQMCTGALRKEKLIGIAAGGVALTGGIAGLAIAGMVLVRALRK